MTLVSEAVSPRQHDPREFLLPQGKAADFAPTHWSLVLRAGHAPSIDARSALEELCRTYWHPLHAFISRKGYCAEDAHDLTQGFIADFLSRKSIGSADPQQGKFRSFLLASLKHFLSNELDRARCQKRGGKERPLSLDDSTARESSGSYSGVDPGHEQTPEKVFEARWAQAALDRAREELRREYSGDKAELFARLEPYLSEEGTGSGYGALAAQLGRTEGAVKVVVHRIRRRYGELIRREVAKTVASPGDVEEEIQHLMTALRGA